MNKKTVIIILLLSLFTLMIPASSGQASGGSNKIMIGRYWVSYEDPYQQAEVTYVKMESDFKVYGDGSSHYLLQGPTFDTENLWDPDGSITESIIDKGAVKGTSLRDLCNYFGGISQDDLVIVESSDLSTRIFGYEDIYQPEKEQGTIVIAWYKDGLYSPSMEEGMHLCVMAKTANSTGQYFFGNTDMKNYISEKSWVYYEKEDRLYPASDGMALNDIRKIKIYHIDQQLLDIYNRANPPSYVIPSFTAVPDEVYPGEEVTITAEIKNTGSYDGIFNPIFYVKGKEERCIPVKIDSGETREVSFTISRDVPDDYDIRFHSAHSSFKVIEKLDIDKSGIFTRTVSYKTADETAELVCQQGTTVRTREGSPITEINIGKAIGMPPTPDKTIPVSAGYDLSPDGACFTRKVSLSLPYSEEALPPGVSEDDLVIGCFRSDSDEWELIDDVSVDTVANTITADIDHFSVYAVFTEIKEEANISLDNLTIEPVTAQADETITATVAAENTGDGEGAYNLTFMLDGKVIGEYPLSLQPGEQQTVEHTFSIAEPGTYTLVTGDVSSVFTVTANDEIPEVIHVTDPQETAEPDTTVTDTDAVPVTSKEESDDGNEPGLPIIPIIIGAVIIIVIVGYILVRRKASAGQ